jgi:hypothetical protein
MLSCMVALPRTIRRLAEHGARWRDSAAGRWVGRLVPPLLILLWIVAIAHTGRWPSGDGPHVLGVSARLAQLARSLSVGELFASGWTLVSPHPPGAYLLSTVAYTLLGPAVRWAHLLAAGIALWLCWDGIRRLGGGWIGGLFLAASALVWAQAESYGIDVLTAACVVQATSHLAASDGLARRGHAAGWGAWMAAGFLAKYSAPMFLFAPCLVAAWWVLRGRRFAQLGIAIAAFAAVAGIWYLGHWGDVLDYTTSAKHVSDDPLFQNTPVATGSWLSAERLGWYPLALLDAHGWAGVLALLVGVGYWRRREGTPRGAWLLAVMAVAGGWIILSGPLPRQDRYLLPALPLLAALAGSSRLRWWLAPVAAIGLFCTATVFLDDGEVPVSRRFEHSWSQPGTSWPWPHEAYRPASLDPADWGVDEALRALRAAHGSDDGTVGLLLDDRNPGPGFGLMLMRTCALGYRWKLATVRPLEGGAAAGGQVQVAVIVGPFEEQATTADRFTVLLAYVREGDTRRERWLEGSGLIPLDRSEVQPGWETRLYRVP